MKSGWASTKGKTRKRTERVLIVPIYSKIQFKSFPTVARSRLVRAHARRVRCGTMGFSRQRALVPSAGDTWTISVVPAGEMGCGVRG